MPTEDPREPFARVSVDEGREMISRNDVAVIDVRESPEYIAGHIPDARLIPVASIFARRVIQAAEPEVDGGAYLRSIGLDPDAPLDHVAPAT